MKWRVDRRGGGGGGGGGYGGGGYNDRGGGGGYERRQQSSSGYDAEYFGPTGHDYERADDKSNEDGSNFEIEEAKIAQIDALLAERLAAKMSRDFTTADAIKKSLSGLGVTVFDREKTWVFTPPKDFGPLGHDYVRAEEDDTEFDEASLDRINTLLKERLSASPLAPRVAPCVCVCVSASPAALCTHGRPRPSRTLDPWRPL
eukprot:2128851-Prymnesium_polylepis.1